MIWAILAAVGVPLWLCAVGILAFLLRNRSLRKRHGDVPVRVLGVGKKRWMRGHALWVGEVFAWRGSPAAWREQLELIESARAAQVTPQERKHLHRLGEQPAVVSLRTTSGEEIRVAAGAERARDLWGPFASQATVGQATQPPGPPA